MAALHLQVHTADRSEPLEFLRQLARFQDDICHAFSIDSGTNRKLSKSYTVLEIATIQHILPAVADVTFCDNANPLCIFAQSGS
jgi:hypothetical protein